jgi:hypothetical protein
MRSDDRWWLRPLVAALVAVVLWAPATSAFVLSPASDDEHDAGQTLTVENEVVTLTLVSADAGFDNLVTLVDESPDTGIACRTTPPGFTALLGRFMEPTELALSLTTPENRVWTTGPGTDNSDHLAHARMSATAPDTVLVEWEDNAGGGDLDFNDCVLRLTITPLTP